MLIFLYDLEEGHSEILHANLSLSSKRLLHYVLTVLWKTKYRQRPFAWVNTDAYACTDILKKEKAEEIAREIDR